VTRQLTGDPIAAALDTLLDLDALTEIAARARRAIHVTEIAPLLEQQALRHDRTAEWHADRGRYDLAAGEREAARRCRERAAAIRTLDAHREQLRRSAERPPVTP
jgi:lipoprotein NlpI